MKMIGHYCPRIQFNGITDLTGFDPLFGNDVSGIIQPHGPVGDFPKQAFPVVGADGDEIGPGLRIIVIAQADGTAVMDVTVVCHKAFVILWR